MTTTKQKPDWGRFESADREARYRILWASQGVAGTGKTHFGLTAPEPIAVHLFDPIGTEGLTRQPLFREKDIRVIEYKFNIAQYTSDEDKAKYCFEVIEQFVEDYNVALRNARTILIDKEDHVWEGLRWGRLEGISGRPASYHQLNTEYRGWISDAAHAGVNLGLIRGMKEVWGTRINRKTGAEQPYATGEYEPRGMKEVPELVQVTLGHRFDEAEKEFYIKVLGKCRLNKDLVGEEFAGLDFPTLATLLYPETGDTPEVWE